ncbi:MAG: hypothetical protein WBB69_12970 [Anaerolineales bacterium]
MDERTNIFPVPEIIEEYLSNVADQIDSRGLEPSLGSPGSIELQSEEFYSFISDAYSLGNIQLEIAADHLYSFNRSISPPILTIAPWASVRMLLESCSISAWLFEPNIPIEERCTRSYALRTKSLREHVKFCRSANAMDALSEAEEILDRVSADAERLGETIVFPSVTDLVSQQLDAQVAYRLCSAMLHGHHWAVQKLGFSSVKNEGDTLLGKYISPGAIRYLIDTSISSFHLAIDRKFLLYGWERKEIIENKNKTLQRLEVVFGMLP